ncbi:MAG: hypothetical protein Q4C98_10480 [Capnocytophaga sp.]|nr:hypothetical protein [Capnocytophaga sp.]
MRKHIIRFFSLDYVVFMFGRQISWTRSANVIFPLIILSGMFSMISSDEKVFEILKFILYGMLILSVFFGFIYFRIKPLKQADYDYFDEVQRFIWDYRHTGSVGEIKNYTPQWVFWVNPILFILTLLLCISIY